MANILPANTDHTDKDFDSLVFRLQLLFASAFPDTDVSSPDRLARFLLELFSHVGDVVCYYTNSSARESRSTTVVERKNMIELMRLIRYVLPGAAAATVDETFTLTAVPLADVVLPAGTVVRTKSITSPVTYQLLAELTIPAGANPPEAIASVEHSTSYAQQFQADGRPDFEIILERHPFLDESDDVEADNGVYTRVASFFDSGPGDRHYRVLVDQRDRGRIRFGDGSNGQTPTGTVTIGYKTGGGLAGNVEPGNINTIDGTFFDTEGRLARISVTNVTQASGGLARQTVEAARLAGPENLRALTRNVTNDDFVVHSQAVPGVARTLMLTSDEDPVVAENTGIVFVIPEGGGIPSQALKDAVLLQVTETFPHTLTFQVQVQDPNYISIDVEARVTFAAGSVPIEVREAIKDALEVFFQISNSDQTPNTNVGFGAELHDSLIAWSDIFNVIRDTTGVRRIDAAQVKLNGNASNVLVGLREFPQLGNVVVIDASTGVIV